jgi:hypothetical protein
MFDCLKYNFDPKEVFLDLFPDFWKFTPETDLEKEVFVEWLELIGSAFDNYQDQILALCNEKKTLLFYTYQHLSLVKLLNDNFDPILKRIFITENNIAIGFDVWFLVGETDPNPKTWYQVGETDPFPKTFYSIQDADEYNFTIEIPTALASSTLEEEISVLIDNYVPNGFTYDFNYF